MPQINKGDTFANGEQVTGARLNQLIDSATILPTIITEQTNLATNTVAANDAVLLYDTSATALREATASDLLNSNIAVTTSSITSGANSDIVITPNDGAIVTAVAYVGTTTSNTVTSNAHGLTAGQVVTISSATGSQYNGTYRIVSVTTNTFTYNLGTTVTIGSGTLSYTRQGTVRNAEHEAIAGNLYVDGNAVITGTTVQTGAVTQNGAVSIGGTLTVTGNVTGNLNIPTAPTSANHATNKSYVDGTSSKTTNGWAKLPNGLIMQWGTNEVSIGTYGTGTITFPIAFPTACLNVSVTQKLPSPYGGGGAYENSIKLNGNPTTTNFSVFVAYGGSVGTGSYQSWFALGY